MLSSSLEVNGERSYLGWPSCPPFFRLFVESAVGGVLGGFTISLDGGLEEVEEFLRSFANSVSNSIIRFCSSTIIVCNSIFFACSYVSCLCTMISFIR